MNKKHRLVGPVVGVVVALSASVAHAGLISFEYTAVRAGGGTVTGTFGFDDSVADTNPDSTAGGFPAAGFLTGSVSGGPQNGHTFNKANISTLVYDDFDSSPIFSDGFSVNDAALTFIEFSNSVFLPTIPPVPPLNSDQLTSPLLPGILSDLTKWPPAFPYVSVSDDGGASQELYDLTEVRQTSQASEPTVFALIGIGLAGIGFARKRRTNR